MANKSFSPKLIWNESRIRLKLEESCLKQEDKAPFTSKNVVNSFIVYELDTWWQHLNTGCTLKDGLFGAVKLRMLIQINGYILVMVLIRFAFRIFIYRW